MKPPFVIRNSCGDPYLLRWTFFEIPRLATIWRRLRRLPVDPEDSGYSLKLHVILRSDDDRALHDHPWTFLTLMLAGGYYEEKFVAPDKRFYSAERTRKTWIKPGSLRLCRVPYAHRLDLAEEEPVAVGADSESVIDGFYKPQVNRLYKPAITLVFMFPKKREWGFYTASGWMKWYEFLRNYSRHDC